MKKYILAIDQGTTGSRAIVYDKKGNKIASAYKEFPQYFPKPGWVEHDPEEIWDSVNKSMQKVLNDVGPQNIAAIGITNQRETTVVWNKRTGKSVYNAIVWQCRRTAKRAEELKSKGLSKKISEKTGLPIDAYFSATKIEWILNKIKDQRSKIKIKELIFGTTDTWVLWKLTGGKVHATDYTNASRTMIFNINKLDWDDELLKLFKIPKSMLPKVKKSSGIFGYTKKIGKLPAGIPICAIAGDQQAALFGQACFDPGDIKNTYGTGCFILLNTGKKRPVSKNGLITTIACNGRGEPCYALEGSVFIAGAAMQWLRDKLKIIKTAADSATLAGSLKSNDGVYFVPAFVGLGAPYWDSSARGIITGLTRGTTKAHIVRAALEAMCYSTKDVVDVMKKDAGCQIQDIRIDGGAVENDFLCRFQADILNMNVIKPKVIETTSLGVAYLAGLAIGLWNGPKEIKKCWKADMIFKPKMKHDESKAYYDGWKTAVMKSRIL